jgi:hypothetical protein
MPIPYTPTYFETTAYNTSYAIISDILGMGDNGYGLANFSARVVTTSTKIKASSIYSIADDINRASRHIYNTSTLTLTVVTGTTVVNGGVFDAIYDAARAVNDNRYVCHPDQYYSDAGGNIRLEGGTSTRVTVWGVNGVYGIEHQVQVTWLTRLLARYFFNLGGVFVWRPYYVPPGLNDIDSQWARFIDDLNALDASGYPYKYTREDYIRYSSTVTTYVNTNTLSISILAERSVAEDQILFTITYANSDNGDLIITPSVGYHPITV